MRRRLVVGNWKMNGSLAANAALLAALAQGWKPVDGRDARVDRIEAVAQAEAEVTMRRLATEEGIFCGVSAGGACAVALRIAREVEGATIVFIVCDRGDRYLSTGVFSS